jgi:hypothetical protein
MNAIEDSRAKRSETDENLRGGHPKIHGWRVPRYLLRFKTFSMRKKTSLFSIPGKPRTLISGPPNTVIFPKFLDRKEGHVSLIKT